MRVWTYGEVKTKVLTDTDLQDDVAGQEFVTPDELVGYYNEALAQAEAEIHKIHEDYFLTHDFVALVNGTATYALPSNIYAMKLRGIVYANGSIIYPVNRIRDWGKFDLISLANYNPSSNDEYQYFIRNDAVDNVEMELVPPAYETSSTIMKRYYIREATRVPLTTETVPVGNPPVDTPVDATIQEATKVDLPQFVHFLMQHMKCRIMQKEGDPRLEVELAVLKDYKDRMVDTLTQMVPDNNDAVQMDMSHYNEMS